MGVYEPVKPGLFNPHSDPETERLLHSRFTDEETEAQRPQNSAGRQLESGGAQRPGGVAVPQGLCQAVLKSSTSRRFSRIGFRFSAGRPLGLVSERARKVIYSRVLHPAPVGHTPSQGAAAASPQPRVLTRSRVLCGRGGRQAPQSLKSPCKCLETVANPKSPSFQGK